MDDNKIELSWDITLRETKRNKPSQEDRGLGLFYCGQKWPYGPEKMSFENILSITGKENCFQIPELDTEKVYDDMCYNGGEMPILTATAHLKLS